MFHRKAYIEWTEAVIKNIEGVVVIRHKNSSGICLESSLRSFRGMCNCGDNDKCSHALWCNVNVIL